MEGGGHSIHRSVALWSHAKLGRVRRLSGYEPLLEFRKDQG
jgi:hypothetical protein